MIDHTDTFVAYVAKGAEDPGKASVDAVLCGSSVSVEAMGVTIHLPWTRIAEWMGILAKSVEEQS